MDNLWITLIIVGITSGCVCTINANQPTGEFKNEAKEVKQGKEPQAFQKDS